MSVVHRLRLPQKNNLSAGKTSLSRRFAKAAMLPNLKEKQGIVQSLWTAVNEGGGWLSSLPRIVKTVIETESWRERQDGDRVYRHDTFRQFIESEPRAGCGWPIDKVERLLADDPDVLRMYRQATTAPEGGDKPFHAALASNERRSLCRRSEPRIRHDLAINPKKNSATSRMNYARS